MGKRAGASVLTTLVFTDIVSSRRDSDFDGDAVHARLRGGRVAVQPRARDEGRTGGLGRRDGVAPYYGLNKRVPTRLPRELNDVRQGVADGTISLDPKSYE